VLEPVGKSETELVIETFEDRIKEIHPDLDRQEFQGSVSGYVHEAVTAAEGEKNEVQ